MNEDQAVSRASRAREVLQNEEYIAAYESIEQELTNAWKTSPQRDEAGRERLFLALTMHRKMRMALEATLDAGKVALVNLQHQNPTMQNQARDFLGMQPLR